MTLTFTLTLNIEAVPEKVLKKRIHSKGYHTERAVCKSENVSGSEMKRRCRIAGHEALTAAGY